MNRLVGPCSRHPESPSWISGGKSIRTTSCGRGTCCSRRGAAHCARWSTPIGCSLRSAAAYLPLLARRLQHLGYAGSGTWHPSSLALCEEAVAVARRIDPAEPARADVLYQALTSCQRELYRRGRRPEGLALRAEMLAISRAQAERSGEPVVKGLGEWAGRRSGSGSSAARARPGGGASPPGQDPDRTVVLPHRRPRVGPRPRRLPRSPEPPGRGRLSGVGDASCSQAGQGPGPTAVPREREVSAASASR